MGIPKGSPAGRSHFGRYVEHRRGQEHPKSSWKAGECGWFLGDKEFKKELLAEVHERRGDHYGPELRKADLLHAERVLQEELSRRGLTGADLTLRRKGDPQKTEQAGALRTRATMTLKWIAQRLNVGHGPTSRTAWWTSADKREVSI